MRLKNFLLLVIVCVLCLSAATVSAEAEEKMTNIDTWIRDFRNISEFQKIDEVKEYLFSDKSLYTCYDMENDFGIKQMECFRKADDVDESYTISVYMDDNDNIDKIISVCVYSLEEETNNIDKNTAIGKLDEYFEDAEEYTEADKISRYIYSEDWYKAYKLGERIFIINGATELDLGIGHIIMTSISEA